MVRRMLSLTVLLLTLGLVVADEPAGRRLPAYLRVLLPEDDAEVKIDDTPTKQTGRERLYVSPPLPRRGVYYYKVTALIEPNNYTKITRTRIVSVRAGQEIEVDLRQPDPRNPDELLIRYVPTPEEVVEAMCKLAKVRPGDVVYDLGCGDGRIVITAVTEYGAKRGVGVDIDRERIQESIENAKREKVTDKVQFRQGDVLQIKDLGEADVVMLYMGEHVNLRLRPILQKSLKRGARVVSHDFSMGDWKADKMIQITDSDGDEHKLYLWTIR
jgi:uncharacterized protein (TIGR03000 family)